ncbi:MAG: SUMF1/EgtB/PvdO family nonheme iron enzyme [Simkaniaceae bacterium]|nr:SUMF1/EgtB/PvdO family nonheme iron enzyme [Simkaniaceae bacterium]MCF7852739.1 SUMF1/EgtB/PvdO family nonheme iron enzyme [Simkaniaceae bacterium]
MTEGQFIGDYELVKQIDKGPLGVVYHAQHRFLKRYYAVRILPEEFAKQPQFIERFQKEVAALSHVEHENVARLHNVSFADGKYYIVSDLILDAYGEYTDLARFLSIHPQTLEEEKAFSILYQIAKGLDHLHQNGLNGKGIAHRYLNLHNILIGREEGKALQVFIQDAGVAHIIGEGLLLAHTYHMMTEALALQLSGEGFFAADTDQNKLDKLYNVFSTSYPFLAPEQKKAGQHKISGIKADIYAFGVLTYFLLVREFPEGFFVLPSSILPYKYDWDALIFHCLYLDPSKRPDSLTKLMESMREFKAGAHTPVVDEWKMSQSVPITQQMKQMKEPHLPPEEKDVKRPQVMKPVNTSIKDIVAEISEERAFKARPIAPQKNPIESNISLKSQVETVRYTQVAASATALLDEEEDLENGLLKPKINPQEIKKPSYEEDPSVIFHKDTTISTYRPQEKIAVERNPILTDMIVIPGGEFYRGSNEGARDERPYHKIFLNSYAIDIHPVTNEQFVRFLEVMGGEKDVNNNDIIRLRESRIKRSAGRLIIESGYARHPVVGVTWYGAVAYAKWIGKRLPTEAEWEIAARGMRSDILYPTGPTIERDQANFFGSDTTTVKSFPPNDINLYDIAGNVYEWCQDWYDYAYYETSLIEPDNPQGPVQGVYRVLRGGCWKSLIEDLRCSHRNRNNPGAINSTYGFRCASDVVQDA